MSDLQARAEAAGVEIGYHDWRGEWRQSPESSLEAVLGALEAHRAGNDSGPLFLRPGEALPFKGPAAVVTDAGEEIAILDRLPVEFPLGYHTICGRDEIPRRLVVSPGSCHLPADLRTWGWSAQIYALRSTGSWGMGDLDDLERLARWSAEQGAGLIMINPLGAATPGGDIEPSPYYPSSRSFRNPLYLNIDRLAGPDPRFHLFRTAGRALNGGLLINRDAVWAAKGPALEMLHQGFAGHPDFDRYCREHGPSLDNFATFCTLAEAHPGPHKSWPEGLRQPGTPEVVRFREEHIRRVRFHKWLQWQLENQLTRAGRHLGLMQDLPVGVDPAGADAWIWGDAFAHGFELGAPPDEFNRSGQCWGITGFHPQRLREQNYEPFVEMIRSAFAHSGAMRIDHVMGLFRLFWIPEGRDASDGVYVRFPARDLLDIVALESRRAQAFVVGEDLGTVEPHVREDLAARSMLSYRLMLFEPDMNNIPVDSMAAVTTHDLPTVAGLWSGSDRRAQQALPLPPPDDGLEEMKQKLCRASGVAPDDPVAEVIPAIHRSLGRSPARVVLATLEDSLEFTDRPNMPGVSEGWPNWKIALPGTLEDLMHSPRVARTVEALRSARPAPGTPPGE